MYIADTLSRAPVETQTDSTEKTEDFARILTCTAQMPASDDKIKEIKEKTMQT